MSNPPVPPVPPLEDHYDASSQYDNPPPRASGMAIASMVLGIAAIPTLCIGIGFVAGIVGLVLGIVALLAIKREPGRLAGKGFAITGIVLGILSTLGLPVLLVAILMPSLGKARELSNRAVCAANLRGTAQSMAVYAADNSDQYPIIAGGRGYSLAAGGTGTRQALVEDTIVSMYAAPQPSVPQNMWLLVLTGQVAPKQFQCKSDPAPMVNVSAAGPGGYFTNFNDGTAPSDFAYSYSFAYPWTQTNVAGARNDVGGWWRNMTDASLPLIADMAPLSGTGSPAANPAAYTDRNANSRSHQRDGQNVAFGDAHAEFTRSPAAGQSNDNIYTGGGGTPTETGTQTAGVVPPIGTGGSPGAWDIYMVPAADSSTHIRR